ncbi:MAG TPA: NAD(P)H-dependent oxidoreductase subunit E [bacterium]|nr:NAD(P)H-dependent oxidoreductase subunit E [bacterium]
MEITRLDQLMEKYGGDPSALIAILQDIQREEGYLPYQTLTQLSGKMEVPLSRIYALATFYRSFSLKPTGRHKIGVCLGTACHVRGGQAVLDRLERDLEVRAGNTTTNHRFTLETVRCLGCCSIGPVVRVDHETFGRVRQDKMAKILSRFE